MTIWLTAFWLASYLSSVPEMPLPVNVVLVAALFLMFPLESVQLPAPSVTQLLLAPGVKLPVTVAFATAAPLLTSRTVIVAEAVQLPPLRTALPVMDLKETLWEVCAGGVTLPAVPSA